MDLPDCFDCKYDGFGHPCRTDAGTFDFDKTAQAIVARGRAFKDDGTEDESILAETAWTVDCEYEITQDHPDLLLSLLVAAMDACETPQDAAFVAAGLAENAIVKHGPELIERIEALAAASAKFRYILSGVWGERHANRAVWERICTAVGHVAVMDTEGRGPSDGIPVIEPDEDEVKVLLKERVADAAARILQRPA